MTKTINSNSKSFWKFQKYLSLALSFTLFITLSPVQGKSQAPEENKRIYNDTISPLAQEEEEEEELVFQKVENMPRFFEIACEKIVSDKEKEECAKLKFLKYIYSNLVYPIEARKNGIEGYVVAQFVVLENGTIDKIKIIRDPGYGLGDETYRVIQLMNDERMIWKPGMQKGRRVRVLYTLPIRFKLN